MPSDDKSELSAREIAELSSLADSTLDPARRAEVEARIAASPEARDLYERERRVVGILHRARAGDRAPAALRARIEAERPSLRTSARRRTRYAGVLAGALAAAVLALVLVLPGGTPGAPSVSQAAGFAALGATHAAPPVDTTDPAKLGRSVQEVYFPNWPGRFGWRAVGERTDRLDGRTAVTVYYQRRATRIAYTIVGLPALSQPVAQVTYLNGTQLRTLDLDGRLAVTWRRAGHTCVLSGTGVSAGELQGLAAWKVPGEAH
jgi:anti-sigma factor RsiW